MAPLCSRRRARALAAAALTLVLLSSCSLQGAEPDVSVPRPVGSANGSVESVASSFPLRRDRFADSLVAKRSTWWDLDAQKGVVLLERAARTGDLARVGEANDLIYGAAARIDDGDSNAALIHGGAFTFLRAVLLYGDRPELLRADTRERLVSGRTRDGVVRRSESLLKYRDELFARNTALGFDISDPAYNPWRPRNDGQTENHRLQTIVTGMLLSDVYAGSSVGGRPVKDATPVTDDWWHYFRDAFLRFNGPWGIGRTITSDHFNWDASSDEQDSFGYFHTHLGDYWMVRDLYSDPVVKEHAEILVDRLLVDYAEDAVHGQYTGYSGRVYQRNYIGGRSTWVLNYLLFDNLGYTPDVTGREALANDSNWGSWLHLSITTGGYDPTNPKFPRAVIDLARNKGDGYLVTEGRHPHANWVERDFALGFLMSGTGSRDRHAGGFYTSGDIRKGGLNVAPFYGAEPLPPKQNKPVYQSSSVLARRVGITRNYGATQRVPGGDGRFWTSDDGFPALPLGKLWVSTEPDASGAVAHQFDAVQHSGRWLFLRERSEATRRDVYLAVGAASGGWRRVGDVQGGNVYELTVPDVSTVWEVSTSDEHPSLEAFMADVQDNPVEVGPGGVTYGSSATGTTLTLDVTGAERHTVNAGPLDWALFRHGFRTPFGDNPHGSHVAKLYRGPYAAVWDWDPDKDGMFDEMPTKVVDNLLAEG